MKTVASIVLNNFKNDSRVQKECLTLKQAGYVVIVVALHEFPLCEKEVVNGVNVHRIKLTSRGWSKKKIVQIIKYLEFLFRAIKQYRKHDIIHCHDLNALPVGVLIKTFFNRSAKVVYDAHEYETEANGVHGVRKKVIKWLEASLIGSADAVITVGNKIADEYVRLYDIEKPALVLNAPPFKHVYPKDIFRETFGIKNEQIIFLYQGGLVKGRGVETILAAFRQLSEEGDSQQVIVFMGYGGMADEIQRSADDYENIYYHKAVSPDVLLNYTSSADFGIAIIEDTCLSYRYCLPNKLFEYLMAGLPVIASNLPEMRKLVEGEDVGFIVNDASVDSLVQIIRQTKKEDKSRFISNIEQVKSTYNWEAQEVVLLDTYNKLYEN